MGSGSRGNLVTTARSSQGGDVFRPARGEEQKSHLRFAIDDLAQQFLRYAVDPVQVLDHHDTGESRQRASSSCCNSSRVRRPISTPSSPVNASFRDFEAEQMEQEAEVADRVEAERRQSHLQLLRNLLLGFAGADAERATHHFDEREERCLLAVGRAASREEKGALVADASAEFVQQAATCPCPARPTRSMTQSWERALSSPRSSTSNSRSRPTKALRPRLTAASNRVAPCELPSSR